MVICKLKVAENRGRPPKRILNFNVPSEFYYGEHTAFLNGQRQHGRLYRMDHKPLDEEMRYLCGRFSNLRFIWHDGELMMFVM